MEERRLKLVRAKVLPERIQALSNQVHVQPGTCPRLNFSIKKKFGQHDLKNGRKKTFSKKVRRGLFLNANIKDNY